jgi:hypothetical protein
MTYNDNGNRYKHYQHWENVKNAPYDYERYGLLNKIVSNRIYNTTNEYLKIILNYYEKSLVFVMKYVDRLKHFKNPYWKNR